MKITNMSWMIFLSIFVCFFYADAAEKEKNNLDEKIEKEKIKDSEIDSEKDDSQNQKEKCLTCEHFFERRLTEFTKEKKMHPNAKEICRATYLKCIQNRIRRHYKIPEIDLSEDLKICQMAIEAFNDPKFQEENLAVFYYWPNPTKKNLARK